MSQQYGAYRVALTATTATTGGAVAAIANPEGETLLITNTVLYVATQSTGAASVDIGVAADATTSGDTLIDGKSVATAGVFDASEDGGTNGRTRQTWDSDEYVTVTGSATTAGLVGYLYLEFLRV